jgi:regulator of protease activity HflC (stomatin/prohibitin superfamily)
MWLNSLLERLFAIIPRIIVIRPDESGFRQVPKPWGGSWVTKLKPGNCYLVWPIFMEYEICKTQPQIVDIRVQSALTADGIDVAVGVSIRYYITDALKALLNVLEYDRSIQNVALGVACRHVQQQSFDELRKDQAALEKKLLTAVREEAEGFGLKIQSVALTDIGRTQNLRLLNDGGLVRVEVK